MRKSLRIFLATCVLLTGAFLIFGYSGMPQKWAIEWAIERNFGMMADVEWGGTVPDVWIKSIHLYPNAEAHQRKLPLVSGFDVRTQYQFSGGRKIKNVRIGMLLIDLDPDDPALKELPFLKRSSATGTAAEPSSTFVPREIKIDNAAFRMHRADGTFLLVDGAAINADLLNPKDVSIVMSGQQGLFFFEFGDTHARLENVVLDGAGRYKDNALTWRQSIQEGDMLRFAAEVEGPLSGDDAHLNVKIHEASLGGDDLPKFLESVDAPVRFAEFGVDSATARVALGDEMAFSVAAAARIYQPRLPAADEPLYDDAVQIALEAEQAETLDAKATVAFEQDQLLTAELHGTVDVGEAQATIAEWSRDQLLEVLPPAVRDGFSSSNFDAFSSDVKVRWNPDTYEVDGRAESKGGGANAAPIFWTMQGHGSRDGSQSIEGTAEARLGERSIRASARYESVDHYVAEATIEQVQIAPWIALMAGEEAAAAFEGTVEGTIHAEAKEKDAPLDIRPDITLKNFVYDTLKFDEITAKGGIQYSQADGRIAIGEFRVEAPDGMTSAVLTNWTYDTNAQRGGGDFALGADFNVIAHLLDQPDLIGSGAIEGKATLDESQVDAEFSIASGDFGYGDLRSPYGTKLNSTGTVTFDRETRRGELRGATATIGDGTTLTFGTTMFSSDPVKAEGDVTLASDFRILVSMGWLENDAAKVQESEGIVNGSATFRLADDVLNADWKFGMTAPKIFLVNDAGSAESVEFTGEGAYDGGLRGTGTARAAKLMAAGGSILNAAGPVLFDGDQMRIQQAKGELFRGTVRADIDVGVLKEGLPIVLSANFEEADLAILTDEVKPPKTQLTGTARGTVTAEYDAKGLHAFTFEAEAPGGLSVNRSLVEELLQSDKFLSGAGANVAEKAMDKLLGSVPQRPFDRGRMNVQLADEKITGLAVLESEKTKDYNGLNLRVTLDMDQSALAEALKMLQENTSAIVDP